VSDFPKYEAMLREKWGEDVITEGAADADQ
jgi:hypothetical protein